MQQTTTTAGTPFATTPQPHGSKLVVHPDARLKRVPGGLSEYESVDGKWYVRRVGTEWFINCDGTSMAETETLREAQEYAADDQMYGEVTA